MAKRLLQCRNTIMTSHCNCTEFWFFVRQKHRIAPHQSWFGVFGYPVGSKLRYYRRRYSGVPAWAGNTKLRSTHRRSLSPQPCRACQWRLRSRHWKTSLESLLRFYPRRQPSLSGALCTEIQAETRYESDGEPVHFL